MAKQVATRRVKMATVMKTAAFRRGFEDVKRGRPFDPEAYDGEYMRGVGNVAWTYERGRQLGLIYNGPLKVGREIHPEAFAAYQAARQARVIL